MVLNFFLLNKIRIEEEKYRLKEARGKYSTNHGIFRHLQTVRTVEDCQESCKLSRKWQGSSPFQAVKTITVSQSVSQSLNESVSQSNSLAI